METHLALQFIALIIAINALITSFFLWIINKDKTRLDRNVKELKCHIEYTESVADSLIEWLIVQEKKERIEQGWIYSKIAKEDGIGALHKIIEKSQSINNDLRTRKQELMLHSNNKSRRDSAFKQLSNAYGDIDSYILMKKLMSLKKIDANTYKIYLKSFKDRIKEEQLATSLTAKFTRG